MPDPVDEPRPAKHIDAEGHVRVGSSWESLIDRQIREAMAEGKFDDLPGHGQPLPIDDNPYAGDMGLAFKMLKGAGVAPPWIEADKHVRELLRQRDEIMARAAAGPARSPFDQRRDRALLKDLVSEANEAIARVNAEAPTTRQHRQPLALADVLAEYEAVCTR